MKKLISILLVAVLVLGMFPATALTAFAAGETYEKATSIAVGDTVLLVCENKTMELSAISTTSTKYGIGVAYTGSPAGKYVLTVEAGSTSGTFSFKNGSNYLNWSSGSSLSTSTSKSANSSWTVTFSGNNATIANAKDGTRKLQWNASSPRFACYTTSQTAVQLYKLSTSSTEPDCEHTNKTEQNDGYAATCTKEGKTNSWVCDDCGETAVAQETTPANGHNKQYNDDAIEGDCETEGFTASAYCSNCDATFPAESTGFTPHSYVDGTCENCGVAQPNEVTATISFANTTQRTSYSTSAQVWQSDDEMVTFTNNKGSSNSNVGNYSNPARLYKDSAIIVSCAEGYLIKSITFVAGGESKYKTPWADTLTDETVDGDKYTVTFATGVESFTCVASAQIRIASLSVTCEAVGGSSEPDCEHTNWELQDDVKETCTTDGYTGDKFCLDCETVFEKGETIGKTNHANKVSNNDAIEKDCETEGFTDSYFCPDCETTIDAVSTGYGNHIYVDGACSVCGEEQPDEVTLSLANGTKRTFYSTTQQVYAGNGITLTNDKAGASTDVYDASAQDHARFYKGSTVTIACAGMTKIVLACDGTDYLFNLAESEDYTFEVDGTTVTVTFTNAVDQYTFTMSENQARVNSLTVSCAAAESECEHTNWELQGAADATCTTEGYTGDKFCLDCEIVFAKGETIAKLSHTFVDGACEICGAIEPARYYIAATRGNGTTWYMTTDLGEANTKRYQATETSSALPSKIDPEEAVTGYVFILTDNGDGTCYLQAEGIEGDNYLGWTSSNSGILVAEANALKLTMVITEEGYYNFSFLPEGAEKARYLSLNGSTPNNYFAWYEGTQKQDLVLIPVEEIAENEITTLTLYGNAENVTVGANQILDLNGHTATNVTGTNISVYDSTATLVRNADNSATITAGEGTLTLTEGSTVIIDNTVDGLRYIALEKDGSYTFHILELKLSAISLRASQAGIYYKAVLYCDDILKEATAYHGLVVSVNDMPGANFASNADAASKNQWTQVDGAPEDGKLTSVAVFGIFKAALSKENNAERGAMKIYANAYIQLKGDEGTIIMADTANVGKTVGDPNGFTGIAYSLKDIMQYLNTEDPTNATVVNFYKKWEAVMSGWNLLNIHTAAYPAVTE